MWPMGSYRLKIAKVGRMDARRERTYPIDFQVRWLMVNVKLLVLILSVVYSISPKAQLIVPNQNTQIRRNFI